MPFSAAALVYGTLIIAAPTSEGLIIAADSLSVDLQNKTWKCERTFKIEEVGAVERTVITVTGLSGVSLDPCNPLSRTSYTIDIRGELRRYVESQKQSADTISLSGLEPILRKLFDSLPDARRQDIHKKYSNKIFGQLIVASFNPKTSVSTIRLAYMSMKGTRFQIVREQVSRFSPSGSFAIKSFGESAYMESSLSNGSLKKYFASETTGRLISSRARISTMDKSQVSKAVTDVVNAVSAKMRATPLKDRPGNGVTVGGAVDVIFVGQEPKPERLAWKPQPVYVGFQGSSLANIRVLNIIPAPERTPSATPLPTPERPSDRPASVKAISVRNALDRSQPTTTETVTVTPAADDGRSAPPVLDMLTEAMPVPPP